MEEMGTNLAKYLTKAVICSYQQSKLQMLTGKQMARQAPESTPEVMNICQDS